MVPSLRSSLDGDSLSVFMMSELQGLSLLAVITGLVPKFSTESELTVRGMMQKIGDPEPHDHRLSDAVMSNAVNEAVGDRTCRNAGSCGVGHDLLPVRFHMLSRVTPAHYTPHAVL